MTRKPKQTETNPQIPKQTETARARIEDLALTLMAIDAQQLDHPGYCEDEAAAIVNAELKILWRESYGG